MEDKFIYDGSVLLIQSSFVNDIVRYENGFFNYINDELVIDVIGKSSFISFNFSQNRFIAQVEIKSPQYRIFDLELRLFSEPIKGVEITRFKVEINDEFKLFKSFVEKQQLEEDLQNELANNISKKSSLKI